MLSASNISKTYPNGIKALQDVNLEVSEGEIMGFIGLNGAGKTTFIKIANGVLQNDTGNITICGMNPISELKKITRKIAWIPQDGLRKFNTFLSGRDNIIYFSRLKGMNSLQINQKLDELLEHLCPAKDFIDKKISIMSGGQKQLCNLLTGFVLDSEFLFCDEISVNIDPITLDKIYSYLREYASEGKSVLLTSQNLHEIEELSNTIALLHKGKIMQVGKPKDISNKLLKYEIIDIGFEERMKELNSIKDFSLKLESIADKIIIDNEKNLIRIYCEDSLSLLPQVVEFLKEYNFAASIESGKADLTNAIITLAGR
ncbi:MAG: ABC transporter ATP-binding protein [Candidatus Heimdallarchaeum aukensis]|uniref:ABC transporter ATP-binding protein n=1 Tax=Candidatus Heimdallarchaeum aukensis TaxID=2876573 RepID=A0A9Y1BKH3_9ARCH|nr:MAG: ABC transporter ATP-binding protein [Candidatus Heimdallarchaeum aukensis]